MPFGLCRLTRRPVTTKPVAPYIESILNVQQLDPIMVKTSGADRSHAASVNFPACEQFPGWAEFLTWQLSTQAWHPGNY